MTVQLMLTCLCDAFYGEVGIAAAIVLEHCGLKVNFPEDQTCCGQPAFNAGDWESARKLAARMAETFDPNLPIVTVSASCAAMLRHGTHQMGLNFEGQVFELSEFLLDQVGVEQWPLKPRTYRRRRVAFHRSCHGRALGLEDKQIRLLRMIRGLDVLEPSEHDQCCGFGGLFSATHSTLSARIGKEKLEHLSELDADEVVSGDMGCVMHLANLLTGPTLRFRHYVQVLAECTE